MEVVHCPPPFLSCPWSPRARVARRQCLRCGAAEASGAAAMETSLRSGRGVAAAAFARQQCFALEQQRLWMRRGFASTQPKRWRLFSQCLDESLVQVGALDLQSMPRLRRPHSARETRFDCELFVCSAQRSVPACPERWSCVPVHATRPAERRRVQTRRPARRETQAASPVRSDLSFAASEPWQ